MDFATRVWRLLVAIKDGLVLAAMLLFFGLLYSVLSARTPLPLVKGGALLVRLDGALVEEPSRMSLQDALSGSDGPHEYRTRDVARAIRAAAGDDSIKAVAVDLSEFTGGGLVSLEEVGTAMDAVRAAKKPVLVYGFALEDPGVLLAAHGSEVWLNPLGLALVPGPGGYHMYYGALLDRLKISAHIFRVGTYKDFVEPYFRNDQSEPAKAARVALYKAIWADWQANVAKARPQAKIAEVTADPVGWYKAAGGDGAKAALNAGLVDKLGTWADFGARVAQVAGEDSGDKRPGAFRHTSLAAVLAAHPEGSSGKAIGVVTVAGDIVDGNEGPGTAGGERIAKLIDQASARKLAALVVRVDSPGGSVTGAEAIRAAIMRQKARGLPVVVSMANLAASGGYWVSTPATRIFAEPGTITGSIGIFAVIPSFEKALGAWGVHGDGVRTTPLSGQPDVMTGLTPEMEQMVQAGIEAGYGRFVRLVADSRHQSPAAIDAIAQGRVWDGASAKANGLLDQFGTLDDAIAYAAGAAHLEAGGWHAEFMANKPSPLVQMIEQMRNGDEDEGVDNTSDSDEGALVPHDLAGLAAARQRAQLGAAFAGAARLLDGAGAQAYCLECAGSLGALPGGGQRGPARQGAMGGWMNFVGVRWVLALFSQGI